MKINIPDTAKINSSNHLEIGGCDTCQLAKEFGTPLYVIDEVTLRENCKKYTQNFKRLYSNFSVIYASKALCATAILKIVSDEGLGLDVSSGGEIYTALSAKCKPEHIYFHGNNKSISELKLALSSRIARIVVDNFDELERIDLITKSGGFRADVLIRVNPGIEAHTHEYIKTGQIDSKFGISKQGVIEAIKKILKMKNVYFRGLHAHIGSQILKLDCYGELINSLTDLAAQISKELQIEVEEINIGGGLGITYVDEDSPHIESFVEYVCKSFKENIEKKNLPLPKLIVEPGRSIIGRAGVTLYSIGVIKDIPGIRKYVVVDGGMGDNPRPMLYQARYDATIANKANLDKTEVVTIAGRYCESGDVLIKDIKLQKAEVSDILVVFCTGAYNYSMASCYNRVPRPAVVLVKDSIARVIVNRESYEDIVKNDIVF